MITYTLGEGEEGGGGERGGGRGRGGRGGGGGGGGGGKGEGRREGSCSATQDKQWYSSFCSHLSYWSYPWAEE